MPTNGINADQQMFAVRELAHDDGTPSKTITFADVNIRPLGYAELARVKLHEKVTIPLEWHGSKVIDTNIEAFDKTKSYSGKTILESTFTSRAIGLVKGGWLPSALATTYLNTTILVDRNVVSQIIGRFNGGRNVAAEPDFLDLFADQPVRINPLLFAMEGNARGIPTPALVRDQLEEVVKKLQAALPSAKLVVGPQSLKGVFGLIKDTRRAFAHRQQFLVRVAPSLIAPVSSKNMQMRWDEVLAVADQCGVSRISLVVLAALSSVVVPNGRSPAKKLLKFKAGYCEEDAYNALADLRSLEILIHLFALFPGELVQLCTADRDLALFWAGIRASNFERTSHGVAFDLAPVEELLPGSRVDEWRSCVDASSVSTEARFLRE